LSFIQQFKGQREKLKEYLKSGNIPVGEIDDLYSLLNEESIPDDIKFLVYQQIKENKDLFHIDKLSKTLNLPPIVVKKIFKSAPIKAKFPIALEKDKDIATAYIIPLEKPIQSNTFSSNREIREGIKTIKSLLKTKNIPIKDFFVIFDKNFDGKSFMLSILAGLTLPQESLKKFAFTGVLNEEGEIFPVGYISFKEEISKENGLILITPDHLDTVEELIYYLGDEKVDIPFVFFIKRPPNEAKLSLKKLESKIKEKVPFFSIEKLCNLFGFVQEDLIVNFENFLPVLDTDELDTDNLWSNQVKTFEQKLKYIYSKFEYKKRVLHFALGGVPSSLAMALGIKLGAKKPIILYHYQSDEYFPVIELSDYKNLRKIKYIRKNLKENLENIEFFLEDTFSNTKDIAVSIWLASHNPHFDVENYLKQTKKEFDLLKIESKDFQGDIPLPDDFEDISKDYWVRYISEIYSLLNILKNNKGVQNYHIFLSVPVVIAFGLGMAVGHFWKGVIYNYNFGAKTSDTKYYPVFKLEDKRLRSFF